MYNPRFHDNGILKTTIAGKEKSFKTFILEDETLVGLFQGNRGDRPGVDFRVKTLVKGQNGVLRTPSNVHWAMDILLKAEHHKEAAAEVVDYYVSFWDVAVPFDTVQQRQAYDLKTYREVVARAGEIDHATTYPLEYLCALVELFTICEKATPRPNKMFPALLGTLQKYFRGEKDYYQVISSTFAGY